MIDIKIDKFRGPLGLLLQIIENEELDITEVSLARIADQYVKYIRSSNDIDPDKMADFLVLAAKLLLIKSKALLPYLYPEEEEEIEELEEQLRMYKEFIEATKQIEKMIGKKKFMFAREFNRKEVLTNINTFSPPKNLKKNDLKELLEDLIIRVKPADEELEKGKIEDKINIEDKIRSIHNMLLNRIKVSFSSILSGSKNKTEIIVNFLAMLELVKQRDAVVEQGELFGEIEVSKQ